MDQAVTMRAVQRRQEITGVHVAQFSPTGALRQLGQYSSQSFQNQLDYALHGAVVIDEGQIQAN
jgi:hypothetical protein